MTDAGISIQSNGSSLSGRLQKDTQLYGPVSRPHCLIDISACVSSPESLMAGTSGGALMLFV